MQWSDVPFHPSRKTLRQFAGLWLVFFGGLAAYQGLVKGHSTAAAVLGGLAVTIGPVGLARPEWLRPIYVGWMVLAFPIGWTISQVTLGALYYGLFTPVALAFRLVGRDALGRRPGPSGPYWTPKRASTDPKRYLRQF